MSELSLPRVSELIRGVIELLWNRPDGLPIREIIARIPEIIKLSDHESELSSFTHTPRYERVIRLATLTLVRAGWLVKTERGQWLLTEDGRRACQSFSKPSEFYLEAVRLTEANRKNAPEIIAYLEVAQEKAWEYIVRYIQEKNSADVRRLVAVLFEALEYHITWVAPPQKNRGLIDMVASVDPIGAQSCRILVQIKHKGQPVTLEGLKSFASILGTTDFGLLMSTGGFTTEAREAVNSGTYQKVNAMDVEKFVDIWIKHIGSLSHEAHGLLPLKAVYFLFPQI